MKVCEGSIPGKCKRTALAGERYCKNCRSAMLAKMNGSGYLVRLPRSQRKDRTTDHGDGLQNLSPLLDRSSGPWDGDRNGDDIA